MWPSGLLRNKTRCTLLIGVANHTVSLRWKYSTCSLRGRGTRAEDGAPCSVRAGPGAPHARWHADKRGTKMEGSGMRAYSVQKRSGTPSPPACLRGGGPRRGCQPPQRRGAGRAQQSKEAGKQQSHACAPIHATREWRATPLSCSQPSVRRRFTGFIGTSLSSSDSSTTSVGLAFGRDPDAAPPTPDPTPCGVRAARVGAAAARGHEAAGVRWLAWGREMAQRADAERTASVAAPDQGLACGRRA